MDKTNLYQALGMNIVHLEIMRSHNREVYSNEKSFLIYEYKQLVAASKDLYILNGAFKRRVKSKSTQR